MGMAARRKLNEEGWNKPGMGGPRYTPPALKLLELFVQGVDGGYLVVDPDLASKEFLDEIVAKAKAVLAAERSKT